jgi:hypothetical protein
MFCGARRDVRVNRTGLATVICIELDRFAGGIEPLRTALEMSTRRSRRLQQGTHAPSLPF